MQYNSETNNQDLCSLADDLAKSNTSSFPIKKKTLYANMALREIWSWIFEAYGGWHYDDTNNTDEPEATATLTADQRQVTLPIDSAHLLGVAYKDTSGSWHRIKPITLEQIQDQAAESEFMKTSGNPEYYRPVANGFVLYPASNFTQASSLRIYISRDISAFLVTDTTKVPGFPSEFHEAVGVYMALRYAKINSLKSATTLQESWDGNEMESGREGGFKLRIKSFYGNRFRQLFPPRMRTGDPVREYI